jgi:hypothetical protein
MNRLVLASIAAILRPPIVFLKWGIQVLYPYTLGHLDLRIARRNEALLLQDVRDSLDFLFSDYDAKVVPSNPNKVNPGFDYAEITIATQRLRLQIVRCRGELGVMFAPEYASAHWHELSLVLAMCLDPTNVVRTSFSDLWELSAKIKPHFPCILEWCQPARFSQMEKMLEGEVYSQDRIEGRVTETEINRNLYR